MARRRTLILTGGGDFTDPWHPFAETSARLAEVVAELGHDVTVSNRVIDGMLGLVDEGAEGAPDGAPDLVIVNAGNAEVPGDRDAEAIRALGTYLARGGALVVMHVAATAFPEVADWERIVGGRWVRGVTMHPDEGASAVRIVPGHPIVSPADAAGIGDFEVWDERYTRMRVDPAVEVLAVHDYEGAAHPLAWAHEVDGARVVYDALGHTRRTFDAVDHARLLQRSVRWVLRELEVA